MNDDALRIIFKSAVLAKTLHASPAWRGRVCELGRQTATRGIYTSLRSSYSLCRQDDADDPTVTQLVDDSLCAAVIANDQHVVRYILPDRNNHSYSLRPRRHELSFANKRDSRNFV